MKRETGIVDRNPGTDFLKALGLALIVLAHVPIPEWLFQMRNFDVPLMVFLSGTLCGASFARSPSPFAYVKKRFARLVLPTWIFLVGYFLVSWCIGQLPPPRIILNSFLLAGNSIGYVWIVRVYFLVALTIPFVRKVDFSKAPAWLGMAILYILYETGVHLGFSLGRVVDSVLFYAIPYGAVVVVGMNYHRFPKKWRIALAVVSVLAFSLAEVFCWAKSGKFCFVQPFKYPPRSLYMLHAAAWIFVLKLLEPAFARFGQCRAIVFLNRSSLWIYLWHIAVLGAVRACCPSCHWMLQFAGVLGISSAIVFVQNRLLDCLERRGPRTFLRVFRG